MTRNVRVSFIIPYFEENERLPRLLTSLAMQGEDLSSLEIIPIYSDKNFPENEVPLWEAISGIESISPYYAENREALASTLNEAAFGASGELLVFAEAFTRFDASFLQNSIQAMKDCECDVAYSDYIRLAPHSGPSGPVGAFHLPDFSYELLRVRNIVAPVALIRHRAFKSSGGFKDNTDYRDWDLWIRILQSGGGFTRINKTLVSFDSHKISFKERALDGRNKAMIVVNNPSFFHEHTVRWALAHLRGEKWAATCPFMTIPGPLDVTRMLNEHHIQQMGGTILMESAINSFGLHPSGKAMGSA